MTVGVLALQGDFGLHARALEGIGVPWREVRKPAELDGLAGLIMPGGESTTLLKLMDAWDFFPALEKFHAAGKPIFGTCAGLILLARDVESPPQRSLGFIDITAERNAYGRQKESFETEVTADLGSGPAPQVVAERGHPQVLPPRQSRVHFSRALRIRSAMRTAPGSSVSGIKTTNSSPP